jgi:DeoR/GlpR family transcriptional regulator of sugar metabolism
LQPWTELASGLRNINCSSTVEYIIRKIFTNNPNLIIKETFNHCAYEKKRNNNAISVNLLTEGLDFLNDSILQKQSKRVMFVK